MIEGYKENESLVPTPQEVATSSDVVVEFYDNKSDVNGLEIPEELQFIADFLNKEIAFFPDIVDPIESRDKYEFLDEELHRRVYDSPFKGNELLILKSGLMRLGYRDREKYDQGAISNITSNIEEITKTKGKEKLLLMFALRKKLIDFLKSKG